MNTVRTLFILLLDFQMNQHFYLISTVGSKLGNYRQANTGIQIFYLKYEPRSFCLVPTLHFEWLALSTHFTGLTYWHHMYRATGFIDFRFIGYLREEVLKSDVGGAGQCCGCGYDADAGAACGVDAAEQYRGDTEPPLRAYSSKRKSLGQHEIMLGFIWKLGDAVGGGRQLRSSCFGVTILSN